MASKEVAKKTESTEIAGLDEFSQYQGAGMETVTSADLLIPRITILQDLSPQLKKNKSEYIEGSEVGQICDVAIRETFKGDEGIIVVPVKYIKQYIEWAPRSSGKGLVAIHSDRAVLDRCTRDEKNRPITKEGNLIQETAQFFCFNLSTKPWTRAFIPMARTQLKKAKGWLNLATGEVQKDSAGNDFTPPLFFRTYKLTSVPESNNDGDWYGWRIERSKSLPEFSPDGWKDLLQKCVEFRDSIDAGEVRVELEDEEDHTPQDQQAM